MVLPSVEGSDMVCHGHTQSMRNAVASAAQFTGTYGGKYTWTSLSGKQSFETKGCLETMEDKKSIVKARRRFALNVLPFPVALALVLCFGKSSSSNTHWVTLFPPRDTTYWDHAHINHKRICLSHFCNSHLNSKFSAV